MPAHGHMTGAPASAPLAEKIAPPEGGPAIADVWKRRAELAGKTVVVRGKVMKFNAGILDRNWIHIQDRSSDPKDGTHDLPVTSQQATKLGDIITATGRLTLNTTTALNSLPGSSLNWEMHRRVLGTDCSPCAPTSARSRSSPVAVA